MRFALLLSLLLAGAVPASPPLEPLVLSGLPSPWDWKPWEGQVSGLCAAGRPCVVRTLQVTDTGSNAIRLPYTSTIAWPRSGTATATIGANVASNLQLTASGGYVELNAAIRKTTGGGPVCVTIEDSDGFCSIGVAYASLPTCDSTRLNAIQADTTYNVWRQCVTGGLQGQAAGWYTLLNEQSDNVVCYFPGLAALLNVAMCSWVPFSEIGNVMGVTTAGTATTLVAGVGAGNAVFTLWNTTLGASTGTTITVPCAAAAGTITAGSGSATIAAGNIGLEWRLTTNGCGTLPQVNLSINVVTFRK